MAESRSPEYKYPEFLMLMGRKIRKARREKGLNQEQLAEKTGLHATYIGQIERGQKSPSFDTLIDIATALDVNLAYLLDTPDFKVPEELMDLIVLCSKATPDQIAFLTDVAKLLIEKGSRKK